MNVVSDLISRRDFIQAGKRLLAHQADAELAISIFRQRLSSIAAIGAIACQQSGTPLVQDLYLLPTANRLVAWHTAEQGITLSSTPKPGGTSPPALQLGGALNQALPFRFECDGAGVLGASTFRWARNELGADSPLTTSPNWVQTNVPTAANVALGTTGVNAQFPAGNYATDNFWVGSVAIWNDVRNQAGCAFDNSTVTVSNSCVYEQSSFINGRSSIWFSPGMLGNQANIPAVLNNNAPFHIFYLGHVETLATSSNSLVLLAACSQTQTGKDILDLFMTGPLASPAKTWSVQRVSDATVTERLNSLFLTGLAPHIFEVGGDGNNLYWWMDGFSVGNRAITGNLLTNRYCLGGVKLGVNAATLFGIHRCSDHAIYNAFLQDSDRYPTIRAWS